MSTDSSKELGPGCSSSSKIELALPAKSLGLLIEEAKALYVRAKTENTPEAYESAAVAYEKARDRALLDESRNAASLKGRATSCRTRKKELLEAAEPSTLTSVETVTQASAEVIPETHVDEVEFVAGEVTAETSAEVSQTDLGSEEHTEDVFSLEGRPPEALADIYYNVHRLLFFYPRDGEKAKQLQEKYSKRFQVLTEIVNDLGLEKVDVAGLYKVRAKARMLITDEEANYDAFLEYLDYRFEQVSEKSQEREVINKLRNDLAKFVEEKSKRREESTRMQNVEEEAERSRNRLATLKARLFGQSKQAPPDFVNAMATTATASAAEQPAELNPRLAALKARLGL